jgi:hypothetical protein
MMLQSFNKGRSSLSDAWREIAVNLINGHCGRATPNHEHEVIGERAGPTRSKR